MTPEKFEANLFYLSVPSLLELCSTLLENLIQQWCWEELMRLTKDRITTIDLS